MTTTATITVRSAGPQDAPTVRRLGALDSQRPLTGDVLLALADGRPVAALGLADHRVTADPFVATAAPVAMLAARAAQLDEAGTVRGRWTLLTGPTALGGLP